MPERVCPHCGADRWKARDAQRTYERLAQKTRDADKLARENGLLRYRLQEAEAGIADVQSRLQRKIVKQARVIRRFEERWKERGEPAYNGHGIEQTAPAAEYDAATVLPGEETAPIAPSGPADD